MVSFTSSMIKNIVVFPSRSRFPVTLISYIAFDQYIVVVVYLNLLQLTHNIFRNRDFVIFWMVSMFYKPFLLAEKIRKDKLSWKDKTKSLFITWKLRLIKKI